MKKTYIYNLSKSAQHVEIGDPVDRGLTITPGNHAWFRRIQDRKILITSRSIHSGVAKSMFLLPNEDNVLITDSGIGSNVTTKMGKVENRATYPIVVLNDMDRTIVPPGSVKSFLFTKGGVWKILNSTRTSLVGEFIVKSPDNTIVFDGISAYILS